MPSYVAEFILGTPSNYNASAPRSYQIRIVRPYWDGDRANCFLYDYTDVQTLSINLPDQTPIKAMISYAPQMQYNASDGFLYVIGHAHGLDLDMERDGLTAYTCYYQLDDTLGQHLCQEIPNVQGTCDAFLIRNGQSTNLWTPLDRIGESGHFPKRKFTIARPGSKSSWVTTDLVMNQLVEGTSDDVWYQQFAYFDQSSYVHIVAVSVSSGFKPNKGQPIFIFSIPTSEFDVLQTANEYSWTSHIITGIDPAKAPITPISTVVIQPDSSPEPLLYFFYRAYNETLQLSFSYFSIPLQGGQEIGNVDPSALKATNVSNPTWTSSDVRGRDDVRDEIWFPGAPAVAVAGGGIFVFIGCTLSGSGHSVTAVMSQKIPATGILDPKGWFCDDCVMPMGSNEFAFAPGIASAPADPEPWTRYPNTTGTSTRITFSGSQKS